MLPYLINIFCAPLKESEEEEQNLMSTYFVSHLAPFLTLSPTEIPPPFGGLVALFPLRPPLSASANLQMNACLSWPWL